MNCSGVQCILKLCMKGSSILKKSDASSQWSQVYLHHPSHYRPVLFLITPSDSTNNKINSSHGPEVSEGVLRLESSFGAINMNYFLTTHGINQSLEVDSFFLHHNKELSTSVFRLIISV
mmetsp:Transcript_16360/g.45204  ORF Transcript_16360/g.45204 Transcript_16360/m.45204 type:complete len:119 (-) Transcript_16360:41-397(-)